MTTGQNGFESKLKWQLKHVGTLDELNVVTSPVRRLVKVMCDSCGESQLLGDI